MKPGIQAAVIQSMVAWFNGATVLRLFSGGASIVAPGYQDVSLPPGSWQFDGAVIGNKLEIAYPITLQEWPTIDGVMLLDAGEQPLLYWKLSAMKLNTREQLRFQPDDLRCVMVNEGGA